MIGLLGGNWGYTDAEGNKVSALRDMTDGGGAGRYGDTFEGGPISGLLNNIGVRPNGYRRRKAAPDRGSVDTPRGAPVAAPNPAMPPLRPVGMNPVTPYDEAARFGLLAPAPNVAYEAPTMPPVVPNENLGLMRPPAFADPKPPMPIVTGPDLSWDAFNRWLAREGVSAEDADPKYLTDTYNTWRAVGGGF